LLIPKHRLNPQLALALEGLVSRCLPAGPGERNSCLLALVQCLPPAVSLEELEQAFGLWWPQALPFVRTKSRKASWQELRDIWQRSQERLAAGEQVNQLAGIDKLAASIPVPAQFEHPDALRRLYQIHAALQLRAGNGPHFLSCHKAAELLGVSHVTAWKHQRTLEGAVL
jgi:hypothetical protein